MAGLQHNSGGGCPMLQRADLLRGLEEVLALRQLLLHLSGGALPGLQASLPPLQRRLRLRHPAQRRLLLLLQLPLRRLHHHRPVRVRTCLGICSEQ